MADEQSMHIACTGIIQRAAQAGQVTLENVGDWFVTVKAGWINAFGEPAAAPAPRPPFQPASGAGHISGAAHTVVSGLQGGEIPPYGQPWDVWKNDTVFFGKKDEFVNGKPARELTWAEMVDLASSGNEWCRKALNFMTKQKIDQNSKYADRNVAQVSRAKVALALTAPF